MMQWTSVNDSLPEASGPYLVYYAEGGQGVRWFEQGFNIPPDKNITHWMPLPEPPK